jgi:hypothetical protein
MPSASARKDRKEPLPELFWVHKNAIFSIFVPQQQRGRGRDQFFRAAQTSLRGVEDLPTDFVRTKLPKSEFEVHVPEAKLKGTACTENRRHTECPWIALSVLRLIYETLLESQRTTLESTVCVLY